MTEAMKYVGWLKARNRGMFRVKQIRFSNHL